ncbi:hypothetical protein IFO70_13230 [Phormidium tenue FACHB-886]|nr:hypothetical protein [Phormidium tenue FACHB-886]
MVWIELAQHLASIGFDGASLSAVAEVGSWQDASQVLHLGHWDWSHLFSHLAARFDTDVFAATRAFFNNFFKSGQAWAMLVGLVLGYLLRGFLTYG